MSRLLLVTALVLALMGCTTTSADGDPVAQQPVVTSPTPAPSPTPTPLPTPDPGPAPGQEVLAPGLSDDADIPGTPALVALGDSIAASTGLFEARDGFVWRVHRALAEAREDEYGLANLSVPGATSASVLEGEQLAAAERAIVEREADTVLVSVGGNDLLGLFGGPCSEGLGTEACAAGIEEAVADYAEHLDAILARLRAAGPGAAIVVLQLYNPFDLGLGSQAEVRAAEATAALNAAAAEVAPRHDAGIADGYAALEGQITATTGMGAAQPDVHPTALGHDLLAVAVLDELRS